MGEIEGTYRVLETSGSRLGGPNHTGVSTLEPGQSLSSAMAKTSAKLQEKALAIKVKLLDNAIEILHVEPKCYGQILLTEVFKHLNLIESDYFGLEFQNVQSYWIWLEPMKPIVKQIRRPKNTMLRLAVKFFPPDPGQLQEEYTRYLFALQIKRDLAEEQLLCSDNTAALLTSHLLQSEIGDYEETADREHLKISKYVPNQDRLQEKIIEYHRQHIGQTPAESDFQVLEIARKLEMYGIKFHLASDREGTKIHLAVSHLGVLVFQGNTKINTFNWSKVRKLSFKRKRFLIKLHPEVHGSYQDTLEFLLGSRDECKNFWKICVEYHTFFRLFDQPKPKAKAVFFSRGSSFRYSGRTQRQLVDYVKDSGMKKLPYERRHSKVKISTQTLNKDLPKQSISFTESLRLPGSPCSTNASFYSAPTSSVTPADLPVCMDSNSSFTVSKAPSVKNPVAERSSVTSAEEADKQTVQLQGSPILHSFQGLLEDSSPLSPSSLKSSLSLNPTFQVSLSPTGQGSSPLLSPVLGDAGCVRVEDEEETKQQKLVRTNNIQKRVPTDRAYFIAKEILATERTYVKDLEVITVWFRSAVIKERAMPETLTSLLFSNIDPIYEFHRGFLREIEQRLALWEGATGAHEKGDVQRIGDIMLKNMHSLKAFTGCLQKHDEVLTELEKATRCLRKLEMVYREFELQKVCYLPLNTFFLKPIQRLIYYKLILGRLCRYYMPGHPDYPDCKSALRNISEMTLQLQNSLLRLENFQKLTELQHDLVGIDNLVIPGREFIREGCLYKLTKKGFQQRMFFLFSDMLLYTSKGVTGTNHFKIHGQLPLHGMLLIVLDPPVEETDNEWSVPHCFTIYSVPKTIVVAASTRLEMGKWMDDLSLAIELVKSSDKAVALLDSCAGSGSNRPSGEVSGEQESEEDAHSSHSSLDRQSLHRANTTMHVCWYRNTSVSMADHSVAVELPPRSLLGQGPKANTITHVCWYRNHSLSLTDYLCMIQNQLSGYLLRKFKNSSGWQKLWVVFTNFCLFFYKTHQDDYPLASLPLLGYTISIPEQADGLHKDFVFKLQFKSHIYFFRAESKYTFERWMEVIKRATNSPGRSSQVVASEDRDSRTN